MNRVLSLSAEFGEDSEEKTAKQRGYDSKTASAWAHGCEFGLFLKAMWIPFFVESRLSMDESKAPHHLGLFEIGLHRPWVLFVGHIHEENKFSCHLVAPKTPKKPRNPPAGAIS